MDKTGSLVEQWTTARPGTDVSGMPSTARVVRFRHAVAEALESCHQAHGRASWAFDVLATLRRQPTPHRATHRELSEVSMVSSSAITQRIDTLVAQGLVERVPNPESRREVFVQLTSAGYADIERVIDEHTAICNQFMAPLTDAERQALNRLLARLLASLGL